MKKQIEKGFFNMDLVNEISAMTDVTVAKERAYEAIANLPYKAQAVNIVKAQKIVNDAKSVEGLLFSLTNYILAHPSEDLKVV